jgi:hypothetical protein
LGFKKNAVFRPNMAKIAEKSEPYIFTLLLFKNVKLSGRGVSESTMSVFLIIENFMRSIF